MTRVARARTEEALLDAHAFVWWWGTGKGTDIPLFTSRPRLGRLSLPHPSRSNDCASSSNLESAASLGPPAATATRAAAGLARAAAAGAAACTGIPVNCVNTERATETHN